MAVGIAFKVALDAHGGRRAERLRMCSTFELKQSLYLAGGIVLARP
jgi:hypothetical protein